MTKPAKGERAKKTVVRDKGGKPLWEILRWPDGDVYVTDLTAPPMSDSTTIFETKEVADAVALAILGRG